MKWTLPEERFAFAGFGFPKWLWTLPKGGAVGLSAVSPETLAQRRAHFTGCAGPYYHSPQPNTSGTGSYELPMRWEYCDKIAPGINHTGWWCDDFQDAKMRGVVIRLPKSRGCIIGWTMGEGMACSVESSQVYPNEYAAAYAADDLARVAAEQEREYQADEQARADHEQAEIDAQLDREHAAEVAAYEAAHGAGSWDLRSKLLAARLAAADADRGDIGQLILTALGKLENP